MKIFLSTSILLFFLLGTISCGNQSNTSTKNDNGSKVLTNSQPEPINIGRVAWQKPELVISMLGDISDKVVAEIGASSGYFAFRLAFKAKKVIAIEIDRNSIEIMEMFKVNLPQEVENRFETRLVTPNDARLSIDEVDDILIVNTFTYIEDKVAYLQHLKSGLKPGGQLMIVDFKLKSMPIDAPPMANRVPLYEVESIFRQAGFRIIKEDDTSLEYQYIIIGENNE